MLGIRMQESCYKEAVCFFPSHHIGLSKQLASLFREHILSNWSNMYRFFVKESMYDYVLPVSTIVNANRLTVFYMDAIYNYRYVRKSLNVYLFNVFIYVSS